MTVLGRSPASTQPLVSVVMTTLNVAAFLDDTLEGLSKQDYRPLEVVAYDHRSEDGTVARLEAAGKELGVPFSIIHGSRDVWGGGALKRAIEAASGAYIAFLDGDDIWLAGKLNAQVRWMEADGARVLCGHDVECFESDTGEILWTVSRLGRLVSGSGAGHSVRNGPIYPTSSIMVRRKAIPELKLADLCGYTDWCLWSDCIGDHGGYGYVPGIYSRYRRNPQGAVARHGRSISLSLALLNDGLEWLGAFEECYPQYQGECRYRRSTLLANHGRLLFERDDRKGARPFLRRAIATRSPSAWKAAGLLAMTYLPSMITWSLYRSVNALRLGMRNVVLSVKNATFRQWPRRQRVS